MNYSTHPFSELSSESYDSTHPPHIDADIYAAVSTITPRRARKLARRRGVVRSCVFPRPFVAPAVLQGYEAECTSLRSRLASLKPCTRSPAHFLHYERGRTLRPLYPRHTVLSRSVWHSTIAGTLSAAIGLDCVSRSIPQNHSFTKNFRSSFSPLICGKFVRKIWSILRIV